MGKVRMRGKKKQNTASAGKAEKAQEWKGFRDDVPSSGRVETLSALVKKGLIILACAIVGVLLTSTDSAGSYFRRRLEKATDHEHIELRPNAERRQQQKPAEEIEESQQEKPEISSRTKQYIVLEKIYHDPKAFTQGLSFFDGKLYEGTGLDGLSQVRRLDPKTGDVLQTADMESKYFGEGLAHFDDDKLIQLTWKSGVGFVYNATTFEVLRKFNFNTNTNEGWGITYNADAGVFIVSDGSDWLYMWDKETLAEKRRIQVKMRDGRGARLLNELEFVNGRILANVWYWNVILSIDPVSGLIEDIYDFNDLWTNRTQDADCFNGISVTDKDGELLVTGKFWPHMYRVQLLQWGVSPPAAEAKF